MTSNPRSIADHVEIRLDSRPLWPIARALMAIEPGVVFLDSGGVSPQARWSILGWRPKRVVAWPQGRDGALARLRACLPDATGVGADASRDTLPFRGGWIGWFAYDLGRHVERLPSLALADTTIPDFVIGEYDMVLLQDNVDGALWAAGRGSGAAGEHLVRERAEEALRVADAAGATDAPDTEIAAGSTDAVNRERGPSEATALRKETATDPAPMIDRATYRRRIDTILKHIREGDIYQANFSHRFTARTAEPCADIYGRLRSASPSPYACCISLPGGPEILSASPELFLRKTGRRLQTRPIKGTRPRAADPDADTALLKELQESEKERAELLMITDLLRNDLGRVAEYGTVDVARLRELESHATVHHAYSVIEATLREDVDIVDILAATMPGGSVTGAPKIRAMEILEGLEPVRRGPYTGAAGFIGDDGDMSLNILIRTLVRQDESIWYQVGGGIVADSDPEAEYEETLAKGLGMQRALRTDP